jgi:hypothetical protein
VILAFVGWVTWIMIDPVRGALTISHFSAQTKLLPRYGELLECQGFVVFLESGAVPIFGGHRLGRCPRCDARCRVL